MRRTGIAAGGAVGLLAFVLLAAGSTAAPALAEQGREGPPPLCQPRLQVFFPVDFTDPAYQQKAYNEVAAVWKRPRALPKAGSKAVVIVNIARDGRTGPPLLHMKSGSEAWDAAAMLALKSAAPFDPLPKSFPRDVAEVHWHFECARPGR